MKIATDKQAIETQSRENSETPPFSTAWRALQIFSLYRVILSSALFFIFNADFDVSFLGASNPELYYISSFALVIFSLFGLFLSVRLHRHYFLQLDTQVLIDIVLIVMMMHASGGATSGLGVLIAVSTSAASILTGHPASLIFSVLASIAVLGETLYTNMATGTVRGSMTQVGILAVTYMATSLLSFHLSRRIIESESVAMESIKGLENMEALNREIIQFMSTGVLVVDGQNRVRLINRSAWIHLGMPQSTDSRRLEQVSAPLARQLSLWRRRTSYRGKLFRNTATGPNMLPTFSPIDEHKENVIVFLEDTSFLNQQAQNLKLASLGRLTASIAHEIRNPLGALSHAAQLMKESEEVDPVNLGLVDIIEKNTSRVNNIIENIMSLSQRKKADAQDIDLATYLPSMVQDYTSGKDKKPQIVIQSAESRVVTKFDKTQLSQVLTNLLDNAARYSELNTGEAYAEIMVGVDDHSQTAFLDVIDRGEGIPPEVAEKLFEPFFTTSRIGTGLGLYLSKELCEANRARLDFIPLAKGGSCFRISFASAKVVREN